MKSNTKLLNIVMVVSLAIILISLIVSHAQFDPPPTGPLAELAARIASLETSLTQATYYLVPPGTIAMWSGLLDDVPLGWAICDGQNGTPDLQDRFVMGVYNDEDPGVVGGQSVHTHALPNHSHVANVPPHRHKVHTIEGIKSAQGFTLPNWYCGYANPDLKQSKLGDLVLDFTEHWYAYAEHYHCDKHSHDFTSSDKTTTETLPGNSETEVSNETEPAGATPLIAEHLPPYYRLAFIMKLPDTN